MATQVIVTNAGLAALNTAIANNTTLDITKFSIGTSADYTPSRSQTNILGTEVFNQDSAEAEDGAVLSVVKIGDYAYEISLFLDGTVGNFTIGEYAFKLSDGTLFAIGVLQATTEKTKNTSVITGNSVRLRGVFSIGNAGDTIQITVDESVFNSINIITTEAELPAINGGSANMYQIKNYNSTGVSAIAIKDVATNSWKYYQQPKVSIDNEILLGKLSDKTAYGSGFKISTSSDFVTDAATNIPNKASVEARIQTKVDALIAAAPGALDTLNELAAALGSDPNFATTVTNSLAGKMAIAQNLNDLANKATARENLDVYSKSNVYTKTFLNNMIGKNSIINGDFNIWQRGTSFASVVDSAYTADRFIYRKTGSMVHDISRSSDVPTFAQAGRLFNYSALVDCQTADTSIGSAEYCHLSQAVEGYNFLPLAQEAMNLSFWVKATKIGTYCVSFKNSANNRSFVAEYAVNASDTWEFKTVVIAASPSAGGWDYTNGIGIAIGFILACGSDFQTTAGAWQTGNFAATANQVNACDNTNNNFRLAGIQLEAGDAFTGYERRFIQEELTLCQRYYEKSYDNGVIPGTAGAQGGAYSARAINAVIDQMCSFKVTKRLAPTGVVYNQSTGTAGEVRNDSAGTNIAAGVESVGENSLAIRLAVGVSDAQRISFHWTATTEL